MVRRQQVNVELIASENFDRAVADAETARPQAAKAWRQMKGVPYYVPGTAKKLREMGLEERVNAATGRHEFVDAKGRVRVAWDKDNHWHKFAPDGKTSLDNAGRVVGEKETAAHIPDGTVSTNRSPDVNP